MARSALESVSEAIFSTINVSSVTTLATGGIYDSVPQDVSYPFIWFTIDESDVAGTFGLIMKRCRIRVHAFSQYRGNEEAQKILNAAVNVLRYQTPTVSNHTSLLLTHEGSSGLPDEDINGVQTKHLVADFELIVQEDS